MMQEIEDSSFEKNGTFSGSLHGSDLYTCVQRGIFDDAGSLEDSAPRSPPMAYFNSRAYFSNMTHASSLNLDTFVEVRLHLTGFTGHASKAMEHGLWGFYRGFVLGGSSKIP